jgi:hypothetical protein
VASLGASSTLTAEGVLIGTPAYMSPEQARGEPLDHRTDLFSLGITLLEILSARQIFDGSSYNECINRILRFTVREIDRVEFSASDGFRTFLRGLLAQEREHRFPSADAALAALQQERPNGTAVRRSSRTIRVVASLAGLLVIAVVAWVSAPQPAPRMAEAPADSSTGAFPGDSLPAPAGQLLSPGLSGQQGTGAGGRAEGRKGVEPASTPVTTAGKRGTDAPVERDSGEVAISCTPWGKVYLDGRYLGTTPIGGAISVAAGEHTLSFTHPHFQPILRTITVRGREHLVVETDFLRHAGYLTFRVMPWAEIFVDDQYRETTPVSLPLLVSAGPRMVRLHHPSYADRIIYLSVGAGDTVNVVHDFTAEQVP